MGWKFWKREPTEAERSLAALQAEPATAPVPEPVAVADEGLSEADVDLLRRADEHMTSVTAHLEQLVGTPADGVGSFMLEITAVTAGADATVVLGGGAHEGSVAEGDVVGLIVFPAGLALLDPDAYTTEESARRHAEALLAVTASAATVVSWRADGPELVLTGIGVDDVSVGSMVTR